MLNKLEQDLVCAEKTLASGHAEEAAHKLARLAEDVEEYVDKNCVTTEHVQYFAFPSLFERLAYKRVERDPRELREVKEPLDRLYSDLAYALLQVGDYTASAEALKLAIRWNPMNCAARLDLAELKRLEGNMDEWLALTFSVFSRASEAVHLARAYANFAMHFFVSGNLEVAAACLYLSKCFDAEDTLAKDLVSELVQAGHDPAKLTKDAAAALVEAEGLPDGANAEIVVCLLMCAIDVGRAGNKELASAFTSRAHTLVGKAACEALLQLILESEDESA